jgi:hypothetical protein
VDDDGDPVERDDVLVARRGHRGAAAEVARLVGADRARRHGNVRLTRAEGTEPGLGAVGAPTTRVMKSFANRVSLKALHLRRLAFAEYTARPSTGFRDEV